MNLINLALVSLISLNLSSCKQTFDSYLENSIDSEVPSKAEGYLFFENWNLANNWFNKFDLEILAPTSGREPFKVYDHANTNYDHVELILNEIFVGFKQAYPKILNGFQIPPQILIVEDDYPNAYALANPSSKEIPYIFIVHKGLLEKNASDDAIAGVIAHELAHLYFGHSKSENRNKVRKFYYSHGKEPLGFLAENDIELEKTMLNWMKLANQVGPYSLTELNGLPYGVGSSMMFGLLIYLEQNSPSTQACKNSKEKVNEYLDFMSKNTSPQHIGHNLDSSLLLELNDITTEYIKASEDCFNGYESNLSNIFAKQYKLPVATIESNLIKEIGEESIAKFNSLLNPVLGVFDFVKHRYAMMRTLELNVDFNEVRYYSHEEYADDAAVRVLAKTKFNVLGNALFFKEIVMSPEEVKACDFILNKGEVPDYGNLMDSHHSHCFRIYHTKKMAKYLE